MAEAPCLLCPAWGRCYKGSRVGTVPWRTRVYLAVLPEKDFHDYSAGISHAVRNGYVRQPGPLRMLVSYYFCKDFDLDEMLAPLREHRELDLFADSGGFSAYTSGDPVELDGYMTWLKRWKHLFSCAAVLDVIGDAQATAVNTEIMLREVGHLVPVLPAFHVGEPWEFLDRWSSRVDYLALGGMVPNYVSRTQLLDAWLVKAFSRMPATTRVHGFGLTRLSSLKKFPFYSVDSSSWSSYFRYGNFPLFDMRRGDFARMEPRSPKTMLPNLHLLREYGIETADFLRTDINHPSAEERDAARARITGGSVSSWLRVEEWLAQYKERKAAA